jgi:hypothetical protein
MLITWLAAGLLAGGLPPLLPDPALTPLRKLHREVVAARREQVELMLKDIEKGAFSRFAESGVAVRHLADAEVELSGDPADGVKWAERWLQVLLGRLKKAEEWLRAGTGNGMDLILELKVAHAEAEIDLFRRREAVKGGPPVKPEDKLRAYTERVKVLTYSEVLQKELLVRNSGSRDQLLSLTIARAEAEIELVKLKESMAKKGK